MRCSVLVYASCPQGTGKRKGNHKKVRKSRKKCLTNENGCDNICKLSERTVEQKQVEKKFEKT